MLRMIIKICGASFVLLMLAGAQCAFVASSGGSRDDEQRSNLVVVISEGRLLDGPVEGVQFESGAVSGVTGPNGDFRFEQGSTIRFFIGDITLGETVPARELMSPVDLVPGGDLNSPAVINIARLLQSLDAVPGDGRITIPANLGNAATRSNRRIASAVAFIDFYDEALFANTASQLVATLTADYPFTAVLVDADSAREHLRESLSAAGVLSEDD